MNWDRIQGEWKQLSSQMKTKWAKLTDDDLKNVSAKKDMLVGKLQERYGVLRDVAEKQVDVWIAKIPTRRPEDSVQPPPDTASSPATERTPPAPSGH